ncbi:LolA-like outer membrane lipoprotein chaperone [Campylobacter jejuni]|uniref:LolA-like outer membrane lipoprotein chaperone n=2 Tax=Campylobacter jejuni TaxID=197 RepID=UPI00070827E0|nr:LolA-like outer membrane lipoprotein chaperone [Campylobacter jejuni]EAH5310824.1 outer membrane lipoprotein chaperone LolA [Campylobacter jejuni]EIQ1604770.1 outer membrane lipoprotein chaperone LolA [Campylobacter jejuni]EIV0267759.1 outer membrane lipoprotein chaperone LolA [Campylobacter jejuni]ELL9727057.1 outer membrane lipoprotein chaperone LolA [Campylobacter jejuni]ELX1710590.1 outer membrane lipoprotein chaperone LolA [Campylobacter jejuni]
MKKTFLIFFIFIGQLFALDLNFNTFSSNFTQIVKSKNSTLSYSGHFILSKDQAYWSYDTPSKKEIYINKNQVTIVEHDLEQVIFSHLDNIPNLNEIFKKVSLIDKDKLVAKYDNINYTIKLNQEQIQSISYKDEFENDVIINLNNQIKNPKINSDVFKAKIPQNYDIVR